MPLSIGVNLRVTGHCNQGGRKYMEDMFSVAFQSTPDDKDLEYAFFGIFDGHGGGEAAIFAKEHLMNVIVKQKNFWSDRDEDVLRAIKEGYVHTHYAMWRELEKWPRTASGLPSTAGTTASIAFIRKGKIYIGHVGDSGIILGYQVDGDPQWRAKALTKDHKPESGPEMNRIRESGGKVVSKSGVPRVVWNRPRIGHKGPVRRSTHIDEIPFLAVARSLGDLWSYNSELDTFVVSPEPDVKVVAIDVESHRCLIFGTDGLWNMLTPQAAVAIVQAADRHNEKHLIAQQTCNGLWINPSKSLVDRALEKWSSKRLRADNTSVVTLMLDPPGPSRSEILLSQKECVVTHHTIHTPAPVSVENPEKRNNFPLVPNPASPIISGHLLANRTEFPEELEETAKEPTLEPIPVESIEQNQIEETHMNENETSTVEDLELANTSTNELENSAMETDSTSTENIEEAKEDTSTTEDEITLMIESDVSEENEIGANDPGDSSVIHQSAFSSECDVTDCAEGDGVGCDENEVKSTVVNGLRHKQSTLFSTARTTEVHSARRRHSLSASNSLESTTKTYVNSRLKSRSAKITAADETVINSSTSVNNKRRHSAITQTVANATEESPCSLQEPCVKRKTRSEDQPNPVDENDPVNQSTKDAGGTPSWPNGTESRSTTGSTPVPVQERLPTLNIYQKNLGKKATPVKTIRRPSIEWWAKKQLWACTLGTRENRSSNCNERRISRNVALIGSSENTTVPQRWLRSDTIAATPVKTLRSRNVDITGHTISAQLVHQYGIVKQSRLSLPGKLKQSGGNGFLQSSRVRSTSLSSGIKESNNNTGNGACSTITNPGCNASSAMAKRVKSPYKPSARSLSTRSRIKRLGK
ncbi:uncharacterized protein LOC108623955 isoform X2 [Ceratina calcarata]|uniref:Uncharacterized protein LOC108623955 isoform X2 n=1 Tax=Ceratina calcarata TaxID=156304 RepID=A0AAJ7IWI8_9HYME|nr:uncharacterized protein LOC108623955 isoform X2 [Ceratina calcarata]